MNINQRIKTIRLRYGLSQKKFGEKIGLSKNMVVRMEKDGMPVRPRTAMLICSRFGVRMEWLQTGEGPIDDIHIVTDLDRAILEKIKSLSPSSQSLFLEILDSFVKANEKDSGNQQLANPDLARDLADDKAMALDENPSVDSTSVQEDEADKNEESPAQESP